jgi:hypothetical protein
MSAIAPLAAATGAADTQRGRPMFTIRGAVSVLDRNEDKLLTLIENGDLLWAFDLALVPERAHSHELRILPQCVEDFQHGRKSALEWDEVARLVVPHDEPVISSLQIQRSCNVCSAHVTALARRKQLEVVSKGRTGPCGSAWFTTASFLAFLQRRRFY